MSAEVERIAAAILYEGYLLWPYRRSAIKNRVRWTIGGVYPRGFSEASGGSDPWFTQTQCLVTGRSPSVTARVRFLQVVDRGVARIAADGRREAVDALEAGGRRYLAWEEASERSELFGPFDISRLAEPARLPISIPAGSDEEVLLGESGAHEGSLLRSWQEIRGEVEIRAERLARDLFRLTIIVANASGWPGTGRHGAIRRALVSQHAILGVERGGFVSLADPPAELQDAATSCTNVKTWPVLVGEERTGASMLSSPIILYDYPRVAPESPTDLFDGTEIDKLLLLSILALGEEERAEMQASDPRAREILRRAEALTPADFMRLHGALRDFRSPGVEDDSLRGLEAMPRPARVSVHGVDVGPGSRVRLRPRPGGDVFDLVLEGRTAVVEAIEQTLEGRTHLAVTIEDDPGRDLGADRQIGHRFFFSPEEVEPVVGGEENSA